MATLYDWLQLFLLGLLSCSFCFEPQQQLGHVLRGMENWSGIIKNNQTKNSGSQMFVWLKQFLSLFLCVAVLAGMTKQVWKVIEAVELLSDGHKKTASVSKHWDQGKTLCMLTVFVLVFHLRFLWTLWYLTFRMTVHFQLWVLGPFSLQKQI